MTESKSIAENLTCELGIWISQPSNPFERSPVYLLIVRCDMPINHEYSYNISACWAVHVANVCGV